MPASPDGENATTMNQYRFESIWVIDAPATAIFDVLSDYEHYPTWWPDVRRVTRLDTGGAVDLGLEVRYVVASPLGYSLGFDVTLDHLARPSLISTRARGDLVGTGIWNLTDTGGVTTARYSWHVATTRRWMNILAPLARPAFSWAHSRVMERGALGLARYLGVPLVHAGSA
jgi:uncharacterized protein YndB with AHSA1/START domain